MIAPRYRSLLEHLGTTRTISELHDLPEDGIGLRHDVDHDLGVALDMALIERAMGVRSTYFVLHTHPYCEQPRFLDRLRAIVDSGHEIGVHLDALGAWWRGETEDPEVDLARWLERVRAAGITVDASAAHGGKACYAGGFANHWIWSELRGEDPASTMDGISAEGIRVDDPEYRLSYPDSDRISRPDGRELDLWSTSLASMGLRYEACTVPVDGYWTDSGGAWRRSSDPLEHDLARGRHQVLVHPWWWRAPRRSRLLLSTARCGTKWLCDRIAARTSATVLHELSLNQDGATIHPVPGLKRTAGDLVGLLEDRSGVARLVRQALVGQASTKRDVVEANVYLAHVDQDLLLREDVDVVHLHRDPAAVVRSILQRGWYDTPEDRRHPGFDVPGWSEMDQVTRACTYWAETNRRLLSAHPDVPKVAVEDLQRDPEALNHFIRSLGLDIHPSLASVDDEHAEARDATATWSVPPVVAWNDRDRGVFIDVCGPVATLLGRDLGVPAPKGRRSSVLRPRGAGVDRVARLDPEAAGRAHRCGWREGTDPRKIRVCGEAGRGAWFGLARESGWHGGPVFRGVSDGQGSGVSIKGRFEATVDEPSFGGRLFAVGCDASGEVIERRVLLWLEPDGEGRIGGEFSRDLDDPRVSYAFAVVLVDRGEAEWAVTDLGVEWQAHPWVEWSVGRTHRCAWDPNDLPDGKVFRGEAGKGAWFGLAEGCGWFGGRPSAGSGADFVVQGEFEAEFEAGGEEWVGRLFAIGIGPDGSVVSRRPLLRLDRARPSGRFSTRFDDGSVDALPVALLDRAESDWSLRVRGLRWHRISSPPASAEDGIAGLD